MLTTRLPLPRLGPAMAFAAVTLFSSLSPLLAQSDIPAGAVASKEDWEEINFEYNYATLTDGFPSLLRLAELLNKNPGYKVKLEGHSDQIGPADYNDSLALRRAQAVRDFMLKYGARAAQIEVASQGKRAPKINSMEPPARFMNRRVSVTVTDDKGNVVSAGGVGDAVRGLEDRLKALEALNQKCCDDILSRLGKLDDILKALKDLANQNQSLRDELGRLKNGQDQLAQQVAGLSKIPGPAGPMGPAGAPGSSTQLAQGGQPGQPGQAGLAGQPGQPGQPGGMGQPGSGQAGGPGGAGYSGSGSGSGDGRATGFSGPGFGGGGKFAVLGANAGADNEGRLTFTGSARYFTRFNEKLALQAQGEYMYFRDRQEGQFDIGLVTRFTPRWQTGLFSSFRTINLREFNKNGTLGQGSVTVDYLFKRGRVGLFGAKAFLDEAVVGQRQLSQNVRLESYLKAVDQIGLSGAVGLYKAIYAEGNFGYLHGRGVASRPGGTLRFVFPMNQLVAFTLEGGMNETLLGRGQNGRVVGGVLFGNYLRPKEFLEVNGPVPVDVPRVRYEVLTRRVRTGFSPPVADAGPDQIGVSAGTVTLDGSASFHPDGDPITFQWTQISGPAVAISGVNQARASFQAAEGQSYSFRLTVRDERNAQAIARTTVTTRAAAPLRILRFVANPATIRAGQSSTLTWQVDNAENVEITGIGRVDARQGSVQVSPAETTTYRLTARSGDREVNETVTVTVERQSVRVILFTSEPMTINQGQSALLRWQTENAEAVEISGVGGVALTGSQQVSPRETTTYTLTARNQFGTVTATTQITVNPAGQAERPRIRRFVAAPLEIQTGESSTLLWDVENATSVTLVGTGDVTATGTQNVSPTATTTYTLTARNANGEVSATATVTVVPAARILSFTATPSTVRAGDPVTLAWSTEGGITTLSSVGTVEANGSTVVRPAVTTTYTLTVVGRRSTVSQQIVVTVTAGGGGTTPPPTGGGPVANAGPNQVTTNPVITLDGSRSFHPDGKLIRFSWRAIGRNPLEIRGGDTARPTVVFNTINGFGEYVFELTVTDADGKFATSTTRVFFGAY